jgi:excisionase family DNA binding protein
MNKGILMTHLGTTPRAEAAFNSAYLTKREVAAMLNCTERFIERQVALGRLKALKVSGKFVRFRSSDVDAFLESCASIAA